MSSLLCLKDSLKNNSAHYLAKIIKTSQCVLAEFDTDSIHFELFLSGFMIQTCMHLLDSGNVGTSAVFLVSKALKLLSLSRGFYYSHHTVQREARSPHFAARFYSHYNNKKQQKQTIQNRSFLFYLAYVHTIKNWWQDNWLSLMTSVKVPEVNSYFKVFINPYKIRRVDYRW